MKPGELTRRIAFAAVAIPLALGIVWLGGWPLALLVAAGGVLGVKELYAFAVRQQVYPLLRTGYISAAAIPLLVYAAHDQRPGLGETGWYLGAAWMLLILVTALLRRPPNDRPLAAAAITAFGVLYAAGLPAFLLTIRHAGHGTRDWAGTWLVFAPMVIVWVGDTAAMLGGKLIGGPKLAPVVSPGKTWAGAISEIIACLAVVPLVNIPLERTGVGWPLGRGLALALALGVVAQVGDLAESLFKREVGVKDSSALIPGHGGVLDRFDALYFALPVAAAFYRFVLPSA
ncbi:MAG: phosphatidate cytidylyltransferase [Gemmatimonadales bacterium]|nr:phosphatidate cytidylyltransferase [Gemmatimonadales bacterium]